MTFLIRPFGRFEGIEQAGEQGVCFRDLALGGAALALLARLRDGLAPAVSRPLL